MNKVKRHIAIQDIITKYKISGQEELLLRLKKKGFLLTQATLSRDLKFLKVARISDHKEGYIYVLPQDMNKNISSTQHEKMQAENIKSVEFSYNLCVIQTAAGFASVVALKIDNLDLYEVLGTIAGDDTILVIPREGVLKRDLINVLIMRIPELSKIIK